MDSLATRMKNYENAFRHKLVSKIPVIVRLDGKAFHTLTAKLNRPFDENFQTSMVESAVEVAKQMQGFKLGYVQSDEASFLVTDYDTFETQPWFDYTKSKVESVSASIMSANFTIRMEKHCGMLGIFDARAFNIPEHDITNYFLWRGKDWERNSVSMYCRSFFSHSEVNNKKRDEQHELLHSVGKNWATDLDDKWKNGVFIIKGKSGLVTTDIIQPKFYDINLFVSGVLVKDETE